MQTCIDPYDLPFPAKSMVRVQELIKVCHKGKYLIQYSNREQKVMFITDTFLNKFDLFCLDISLYLTVKTKDGFE